MASIIKTERLGRKMHPLACFVACAGSSPPGSRQMAAVVSSVGAGGVRELWAHSASQGMFEAVGDQGRSTRVGVRGLGLGCWCQNL